MINRSIAIRFADGICLGVSLNLFRDTSPLITPPMHVHDNTERLSHYHDETAGPGEFLQTERDAVLYVLGSWDKRLDFLDPGKCILAGEYVCRHALVRDRLNPSNIFKDSDISAQIDFSIAQNCFREIEKAHRILNGCSTGVLTSTYK